MSITDENQLCRFILECPIMINLYSWLNWTFFFEPKYGNLKSFIRKHKYPLKDLLLIETSAHELLRLPIDASLKNFEDELSSLNVCLAVGQLCSLIICEYGITTRIPLNVYRTSMRTWFIHLKSLSVMHNDNAEPMKYILEFLTYIPILIGQTRFIQEAILGPLDDVFWNSGRYATGVRTQIWELANANQRNKLEIWGHTLDIREWKNDTKWSQQNYRFDGQVSIAKSTESQLVSSKIIMSSSSSIQNMLPSKLFHELNSSRK